MDLETFENLKSRLSLAQIGKPALIGIVIILVMVAVAAGRLLLGTATASEFELTHDGPSIESSAGQGEPQEESTIFVHVTGEVDKPGLYEVARDARVADAVQAAGGFTDMAETSSVNLARVLTDGEQIVIGKMLSEEERAALGANGGGAAAAGAQGVMSGASSGLVNINTATASELESLPGIGESTAGKIIADRQANGSFKTIEDIKRVSGIGDKKFESISGLICV